MSSLLVFCLGWRSNFVGSESGQGAECLIPAEYGLQQKSTPPPPHSHTLYVYFGKGGRGEGSQREGTVDGQQLTRGVANTNMTDCLSSL